jgi:hypothetical protein
MKLAGFLALALASLLGAWAARDYSSHESDRDIAVFQIKLEAEAKEAGVQPLTDSTGKLKDIGEAERYDAIIGVAAACILIGSVVLFSQSKTPTVP